MIATLDRYFLGLLLNSTIVVTGGFSMAIWLTQSLRFLDMAVNGGAPLSKFLLLVFLTLPNFIAAIFPVVLFIVAVHGYNRALTDREILVANSAGIGRWRMARPALLLGLIGAFVILSLGGWLAPVAQRNMKAERDSLRSEYAGVLIRKGVFNSFGNGITLYVKDRTAEGELQGIVIHEQPEGARPVTVLAKSGALLQTDNGPRALVIDGLRQEVNPENGQITQLAFERYAFDLQVIEPEIGVRWHEASERTLNELFDPGTSPADLENADLFKVEGHIRLATPLLALGLPMMAAAIMMTGEFKRRGQSGHVMIAVVAAILAQSGFMTAGSLAKDAPTLTALIYVAALLPLVTSVILFNLARLSALLTLATRSLPSTSNSEV